MDSTKATSQPKPRLRRGGVSVKPYYEDASTYVKKYDPNICVLNDLKENESENLKKPNVNAMNCSRSNDEESNSSNEESNTRNEEGEKLNETFDDFSKFKKLVGVFFHHFKRQKNRNDKIKYDIIIENDKLKNENKKLKKELEEERKMGESLKNENEKLMKELCNSLINNMRIQLMKLEN